MESSPRRPSRTKSEEIDDSQIPHAIEYLNSVGFTNVQYTKRGPTEFKAAKAERPVYVELRVTSPESPRQNHFIIALSKLRILEKLSLQGEVYVLLYDKQGFRLIPFDEIPNHPEISISSRYQYVATLTHHWTFLICSGTAERSVQEICKETGLRRREMLDALIHFGRSNLTQFNNYVRTRKNGSEGRAATDFADIGTLSAKRASA